MKYNLVALSFAALASASCTTGLPAPTDHFNFDRMLPTYPELEPEGAREYAGGFEQLIAIRIQLG